MAALAAEGETATLEAPAPDPAAAAPVAASPTPRAPEGGAGAKAAKKPAKGEKGAKKKGADEAVDPNVPSIAGHPRAVRSVARVKAWGGLAGFFVGGYLSLPTHTLVDAGLRALAAGTLCYVAAWAGAVFVWRRLVVLEIKAREQQLAAAHDAEAPEGLPSGG